MGAKIIPKLDPNGQTIAQVAALPYRHDANGLIQILLVTSRTTRRWIIPKGWPMKGLKDHKAAEKEAFEEAGLTGRISKDPLGTYEYWKRGASTYKLCLVTVFPMCVEQQAANWPEKDQRSTRWLSSDEAAVLVDEQGLQAILKQLPTQKLWRPQSA